MTNLVASPIKQTILDNKNYKYKEDVHLSCEIFSDSYNVKLKGSLIKNINYDHKLLILTFSHLHDSNTLLNVRGYIGFKYCGINIIPQYESAYEYVCIEKYNDGSNRYVFSLPIRRMFIDEYDSSMSIIELNGTYVGFKIDGDISFCIILSGPRPSARNPIKIKISNK